MWYLPLDIQGMRQRQEAMGPFWTKAAPRCADRAVAPIWAHRTIALPVKRICLDDSQYSSSCLLDLQLYLCDTQDIRAVLEKAGISQYCNHSTLTRCMLEHTFQCHSRSTLTFQSQERMSQGHSLRKMFSMFYAYTCQEHSQGSSTCFYLADTFLRDNLCSC